MWGDIDPIIIYYDWLNKFYNFGMVATVRIVSRCGLTIEACHRNQPNKRKLALYKPLLHLYSNIKQLYISNNIKCFSYKGGCGIHGRKHVEMFKRRAGLSYR